MDDGPSDELGAVGVPFQALHDGHRKAFTQGTRELNSQMAWLSQPP